MKTFPLLQIRFVVRKYWLLAIAKTEYFIRQNINGVYGIVDEFAD